MPTDAANEFVDYLREFDGADLRVVLAYDGDDYTRVFVRDDVDAQFTDQQFEEMTKQLILKGLDDPPKQPEFGRYGHLDVVMRWFHEALIVYIPVTEWGGVIVTFDRSSIEDTEGLVDVVLEFVDDPEMGLREEMLDEEGAAEAAQKHFD